MWKCVSAVRPPKRKSPSRTTSPSPASTAALSRKGATYRVYDEQSTAGTWVNEQRVPEYGMQLVDGDEIRVGAVRLRFRQP
jgi:predicted component of type VI protein secretion system